MSDLSNLVKISASIGRKKFKFKTSRGEFALEIDETKKYIVKSENCNDLIIYRDIFYSGEIFNRKHKDYLYDGWFFEVVQLENGEFWVFIELSDGHYGAPEYLLEEIESEEH